MRTARPAPALYRAAAALPFGDRGFAVHGLRNQLRIMARAAHATPDWTTLTVTGPVTIEGAQDRCLFEWTACVAVPGALAWDELPDPEPIVPNGTTADDTAPLGVATQLLRPATRRDGDRPAA